MSERSKAITWGLAGLLAVTAALLWLVFDRCYCYWHQDWGSRPMLHIKSLSTGCEALSLPEPWSYPDGELVRNRTRAYDLETGETFEDYEFRKSSVSADEVLFALTNRPAFARPVPPHRTSLQRYAFRFPALSGHPEQPIRGLRRVDQPEWDAAAVMPLSHGELVTGRTFEEFADDRPVLRGGRSFNKTENHYYINSPALLSPSGRLLAVMSYGPRRSSGNAAWDPFGFDWSRFTVDLYRVADGHRIGRVRVWDCYEAINDAEWHGDKIFTVPRERSAQHFIICGFHWLVQRRAVSASRKLRRSLSEISGRPGATLSSLPSRIQFSSWPTSSNRWSNPSTMNSSGW